MGEMKDASNEAGILRRTHIGGQALIEGIMMRGKYNWAVAVRQPDGTIYTEEHDLASGKKKNAWMYAPVVRGCTAFVESLMLGYKALEIAGNHAYDFSEDEEDTEGASESEDAGLDKAGDVIGDAAEDKGLDLPDEPEEFTPDAGLDIAGDVIEGTVDGTVVTEGPAVEESLPSKGVSAEKESDEGEGLPKGLMTVSMILGLVLGVVIFVVLPAVIANLIMGDYGEHTFWWNVIDGIVRVAVFIAYIWLISLMKDIKRMFAYHGAEHKTIHCYEHGDELTPENAAKYPRLHVRCGTAFLIMVMIIAILVFTIVPLNPLIEAMGVENSVAKLVLVIFFRILLLPVVAGLSYEITVKWAGSRPENPLVRIVLWPGMQMQRLTTNVPDEGMLECAIAAMNLVLAREKEEIAKGAKPADFAVLPCDVAERQEKDAV